MTRKTPANVVTQKVILRKVHPRACPGEPAGASLDPHGCFEDQDGEHAGGEATFKNSFLHVSVFSE